MTFKLLCHEVRYEVRPNMLPNAELGVKYSLWPGMMYGWGTLGSHLLNITLLRKLTQTPKTHWFKGQLGAIRPESTGNTETY